MNSVQKFQVQVLKAWKAGLATEKKKLELCKSLLNSPHADPTTEQSLELEVQSHERQIQMFNNLIKQAKDKS